MTPKELTDFIRQEADGSPILILMMGIPASGKSTFVARHLQNFSRINLDNLRTREREDAMLHALFISEEDIVVDNTNVSPEEREKYFQLADQNGYMTVGIFMESILNDCLKRNAQREGDARIPDVGVEARAKNLVPPTDDEPFDYLFFAKIKDGDFELNAK
ncbi:MAG: ATP-binding protein [Paludibacteraceae bacterium]|nr:ATP-binding protein [Paludibacteraceae bacterium]